MKKVILTAAIVLGGLSTYANSAFAMNTAEVIELRVQQDYKLIDNNALPKAVKDALAADFPTATLDKAYVNDSEEYKLDVNIDETAISLYVDKDGNWIEK